MEVCLGRGPEPLETVGLELLAVLVLGSSIGNGVGNPSRRGCLVLLALLLRLSCLRLRLHVAVLLLQFLRLLLLVALRFCPPCLRRLHRLLLGLQIGLLQTGCFYVSH